MNKVQLISPPMIAYQGDIFGMIPSPPIGLASLAAYLKERGVAVSVLDCFGEAPLVSAPYRDDFVRIGLGEEDIIDRIAPEALLIGISVHSGMVAPFCLELARKIKEGFQIPVVVGGPHVSVRYMDFLEHGIDFAVIGEGEQPLFALLEQLEAGSDATTIPGVITSCGNQAYLPHHPVEIDTLPFPAWELLPLENYWSLKMSHSPVSGRFVPMITSRGCPFDCSFCSTPKTSGRRWRAASPERVLKEIEYLIENFGVQDIFIQDDNFSVAANRVIRLCNLLQQRSTHVRLSLPSGVRLETMSPEVIDALARGGFQYLCLAPESGSPTIRARIKKPLDETKLYNIQKQCKNRGIRSGAFIIIGTPGETMRDLFLTAHMIAKLIWLGADDISIFIFSPIPGSSLAHEFTEEAPADYLGICWTPKWRKDFKKLSFIRKLLYAEYIMFKLLFQPFALFRHIKNIKRKTFETKGEMGLSRLLSTRLSRHNNLPWGN